MIEANDRTMSPRRHFSVRQIPDSFYKAVMKATGRHHPSFGGGPPEAPTLHTHHHGLHQIVASDNDGFEVWFGFYDKWNHHIHEREARRLFWWLLFRWFGQARWFGLRRPIYYWALSRHVEQFQRRGQVHG